MRSLSREIGPIMAKRSGIADLADWRGLAGGGIVSLVRRRAFWATALAFGLLFGGRAAWSRYSDELTAHRRLTLGADNLLASPQPPWIKSNVVDSALRIGALEGRSLLDGDLVSQVRDAFAVQAWVADVVEVRKTPTGVFTTLDYRRPVAMVEIEFQGESKFQPIDGTAVLLPGNEFSKLETWNYLKIAVLQPAMHGLIDGRVWPDPRIESAARIAAAWEDRWADCGVYRIQLVPPPLDAPTRNERPVFELHLLNRDKILCRRVLWGHAPGEESAGEAPAAAKIEAMLAASRQPDWLPEGTTFRLDDFDFDVRTGEVVRRVP